MIDCAYLLDEARRRTGLADFGDEWPLENCREFLRVLQNDQRLSAAGLEGATMMVAQAFDNRLRHIELLKRNPEIFEERIDVAAVIASLPRTGSTLLHRMLAATPALTAPIWFETQNYAPFPGEERGHNTVRKQWAQAYLDQILAAMPELPSIHPLAVDAADEEIPAMGLLFSSLQIEGTYFVPEFSNWLTRHSRKRVYPELRSILQSWQWQEPSRAGLKWVLKTPGHLLALDAVAETFPDALIVMTHRDPVDILPSFASLTSQFYQATGNYDPREIGDFWLERLGTLLDTFLDMRATLGEGRFHDVRYEDLLADPVSEGLQILERAQVSVPGAESAMRQWLAGNSRGQRPPHQYSVEEFGLTEDRIRERFSRYRERFIDSPQ
ncbi:sulfotransferase family protein [Tsuneonella aeria]|nr:sulfotransferase [Tsuneonella aeria]